MMTLHTPTHEGIDTPSTGSEPAKEELPLPVVDFCGLNPTRLVIGANPFGGFSHQSRERDIAMRDFHTVDQIQETWRHAESAGINTMVTNNETPHVVEAVREYLSGGAKLQWIAQLNANVQTDMLKAIDTVVEIGCSALFFHGRQAEDLFVKKDGETLAQWVEHAKSAGVPVGSAGHMPAVHDWMYELDLLDFHVVCFFNCGSLHEGKGHRFHLADVTRAVACIQRIQKPCIGYKIMGAGRIDPRMAFEYAFEQIKPTDIVNVGMHRGDKENIVEENAGIVRELLAQQAIS